MMNVKIKNYKYKIIEVDKSDKDFINENGSLKLYGQTDFLKQTIKIYKYSSYARKKETLMHELTHAFMDVYLASQHIKDTFDEEDICCFLASYGEDILKITNKYMECQNAER